MIIIGCACGASLVKPNDDEGALFPFFLEHWPHMVKEMIMAQPFGGVQYSFKGIKATMEEIFGKEEISATEMSSKLWAFIKTNNLKLEKKGA